MKNYPNLLDSGSDGDLLFHKKRAPKSYPYLTRHVSKSWSTLYGIFHTKGKGSLQFNFFEYSNSKTVDIQPEIVEYDETLGKPAFDLIIGTKTMNEQGIILDFNTKVITIDGIVLPMKIIDKLPTSNEEALGYNNSLAKNQEPNVRYICRYPKVPRHILLPSSPILIYHGDRRRLGGY